MITYYQMTMADGAPLEHGAVLPERFASLTAVPGFPQTSDYDKLDTLTHIPIQLYKT